ncbi:hypothetical protein B566_EDAN009639 [Ephemera danica]|nr:hypothetical protein B566_EDAN009639 [Ephemera danica]
MEINAVFRNMVEMIFNNWTALQLAVEHGMAGPQSRQVAMQFIEYILETFHHKALEVDEVEDILIDILDNQFHTECEDGSPYEVAAELCRMFEICRAEDIDQQAQELEKLQRPGSKLWIGSKPASNSQVDEQKMPSEGHSETPPPQLMETDSDGWTTVTSRRK